MVVVVLLKTVYCCGNDKANKKPSGWMRKVPKRLPTEDTPGFLRDFAFLSRFSTEPITTTYIILITSNREKNQGRETI
jgi:hypothetical protein